MSVNKPLVSVVVPAHCASTYIERTLESILSQTFQNFELLVVDDGSTDDTFDRIMKVAKRDSRVRVFRQSNQGVAAARNYAIKEARGEFIAPIDQDDLWSPLNLERQVACLENEDSSVGVSYAWSKHIDKNGLPLERCHAYNIEGDVYTTLLCHYFLGNASCTIIRKSCLTNVGLYTDEFRQQGSQGCEDWDLYLRLANEYSFKVVPEFLIQYRKTDCSMSRSCEAMATSHALVLSRAERRAPISRLVRCLSTSSFYIHLAHESAIFGKERDVIKWIVRAIQVDYVTPFMRFDVYLLALQAIVSRSVRNYNPTKPKPPTAVRLSNGVLIGQIVLPLRMLAGSALHLFSTWFFSSRHSLGRAAKNGKTKHTDCAME